MRWRRAGRYTWVIALLLMALVPGRSLALTDEELFDYRFVTLSHNTLRGAAGGAIRGGSHGTTH